MLKQFINGLRRKAPEGDDSDDFYVIPSWQELECKLEEPVLTQDLMNRCEKHIQDFLDEVLGQWVMRIGIRTDPDVRLLITGVKVPRRCRKDITTSKDTYLNRLHELHDVIPVEEHSVIVKDFIHLTKAVERLSFILHMAELEPPTEKTLQQLKELLYIFDNAALGSTEALLQRIIISEYLVNFKLNPSVENIDKLKEYVAKNKVLIGVSYLKYTLEVVKAHCDCRVINIDALDFF